MAARVRCGAGGAWGGVRGEGGGLSGGTGAHGSAFLCIVC